MKMEKRFLEKLLPISLLILVLLLTGCEQKKQATPKSATHQSTTTKSKKSASKKHKNTFKINLHKKYKGFKLATVPASFRGTWYRSNPYNKKANKLIISRHIVNETVVYQQIDPNLRLNHNSAKQNKEYAGDGGIITTAPNQIKVRGFLDTVDLIYTLGNFKGHPCLYLSYGTNPKAVNGIVFKDKQAALKYRKYDLSRIKL